jgi:acylpyruvate hydrolase
LNYADHALEQGKSAPEYPMMFAKGPNSLSGDGDVTPYPIGVEQYDYEVELAFVMGKRARKVSREDAYAHVAGYAVFMDLSARDLQKKEAQWFPRQEHRRQRDRWVRGSPHATRSTIRTRSISR